jgi:hypothetical protein
MPQASKDRATAAQTISGKAIVAGMGALALLFAASSALAWGDSGHRMVGRLGAEALPAELPAFLHTRQAIQDIGELAREPDRSRGSGRIHDNIRDPAHFVDVDDEGKVLGGPALAALPPTRSEYDTALRAVGTDITKAGWLPYALVDGWQQLAKDFAYWRAASAGERLEKDPARKAWLASDRARRERQVIVDLGVWAHYVGDATQPMHVSVHYNGWGDGPNPRGFTTDRIHVPFEGPFVRANVQEADVRAKMRAYRACRCPIERRTAEYLIDNARFIVPFYEMEKAGGLKGEHPAGAAFAAERLAAAASELRDLVQDAWSASASVKVGYPESSLADIESGKADAYSLLYGGT